MAEDYGQFMEVREPRAALLLGVENTAPAAALQMGCAGCVGGFGDTQSWSAAVLVHFPLGLYIWPGSFSVMSGMVCCSGLGGFLCLRIKSLMLSIPLGQGDFAMTVLPLLIDLVPFARLNWYLLPTEKVKRPPGCPMCLT